MNDHTPQSWEARADAATFYGFTDLPTIKARGAVVLTHGRGPYVYDVHGREYLDANSGLWNMVAGFDHRGLIEAAKAQYERFPGYHAFFGRISDQAVMLSEKLVEVSPFESGKVFYTNSGSEANDTMVKMLWFLHASEGNPQRRKILTRWNAYHGVTAVSASMTGKPYNSVFGLPLPGFIHVSTPHHYHGARPGESEEEFATRLAEELGFGEAEVAGVRNRALGFVWQRNTLLAEFTALENVVIPQLLAGAPKRRAEERARALLIRLGLEARLDHRPARLSGGEQQRVALARALANAPALLLADEPTGNLDPATAREVLALLLDVVREAGTAALVATHDPDLAREMDVIFRLVDGRPMVEILSGLAPGDRLVDPGGPAGDLRAQAGRAAGAGR